MDPMKAAGDVVQLARALVDIDSTTGHEADAIRWLETELRGLGFAVTTQPVDDRRHNLVVQAGARPPRVVLSTHIDCVPPFFPSRIDGDRLFGRGACDAKGILAAQICALERLRADGVGDAAVLVVVGEERGSDGAQAANAHAPGSAFLVDGEPTDNRLGLATRGILRVRLHAHGRAAHSSHPTLGVSAIDRLVDAIVQLRGIGLPEDAAMGRTFYTVGVIQGGVAPNVVSPDAYAEVLFRTVGPASAVRACLAPLEALVEIEHVLEVPPVRLDVVDGFEVASFPYTTDIPLLSNWGRPLLYGPGSVLVAHTADEHIEIPALYRAVDDYVRLVQVLRAR